MIGAYGDTACSPRYDSKTRKPQLGVSHSARSRSPYWIRTGGQATAAHGTDVYLLAWAPRLVWAKQESALRPRMVTGGVGHHRRSNLQRRRVTTPLSNPNSRIPKPKLNAPPTQNPWPTPTSLKNPRPNHAEFATQLQPAALLTAVS